MQQDHDNGETFKEFFSLRRSRPKKSNPIRSLPPKAYKAIFDDGSEVPFDRNNLTIKVPSGLVVTFDSVAHARFCMDIYGGKVIAA